MKLDDIANFSYSYENSPTSTINDRFTLNFAPVTREVMPWRDEVLATARDIACLAGDRELVLCFSGGIDSEVIARAFMEVGVKFSVLTIRYYFDNIVSSVNSHDIQYAIDFCNKHHLPHSVESLNLHDFMLTDIPAYIAQGYRGSMLYRYVQLHLLDNVSKRGGVAVMGCGVQRYMAKDNVVGLAYKPDYVLPADWCVRNNELHFPWFFKQNPHIFAAYMQHELVNLLLSDPAYYQNAGEDSVEKILVYGRAWSDLVQRPKYTGFEQILPMLVYFNRDLAKRRHPDLIARHISVANIKAQLGI